MGGGKAGLSVCFSLAAACSVPSLLPCPTPVSSAAPVFPSDGLTLSNNHEMRDLVVEHPLIHQDPSGQSCSMPVQPLHHPSDPGHRS